MVEFILLVVFGLALAAVLKVAVDLGSDYLVAQVCSKDIQYDTAVKLVKHIYLATHVIAVIVWLFSVFYVARSFYTCCLPQ